MEQRLQKLLAQAGTASRRRAEDYLRAGRVTVNGAVARIGQRADPCRDDIRLDGRPLAVAEEKVYLLLHKPRGYLSTVRDDRGRKTVLDLLPEIPQRLYPVGRLDYDSEGLLLLSNDGDFAHHLLHPSHEVDKTYRVTVSGAVEDAPRRLAALRTVEGRPIRPPRVRLVHPIDRERAVLEITIHQGRNRQIRKMCAQCGLSVQRLRRIREGRLSLGALPPGAWRHLTPEEVSALWEE